MLECVPRHVCVLACSTPCTHSMPFQGHHVVCEASFYGNWLSILWQKCTNVSDWHMLNPSLCHWDATNWSVCVCVCVCVCVYVCEWGCMCAKATDPKGIRLISEGFQASLGSCMHVCLYLLSCSPHAEFNCAARERCRRQIPWLGYPWFTRVTLERETEHRRGREKEGECFGILRR